MSTASPQTPAISHLQHQKRRPRLELWPRQIEQMNFGQVMNRKMMMISYEDEIDTASHRKQRRRRRRPAAAQDETPATSKRHDNEDFDFHLASDRQNVDSRIESSPSKISAFTTTTRKFKEDQRRGATRHLRWLLMLALIPLILLLTLPMVTRTEAALDQQQQANTWRTSIDNGQLNAGPPEETAPLDDDSFGSRLAAASPRLDEAESSPAWNENSPASLQTAFMSRQGQLGEQLDQQQQAARRQARQPPPQMQQQRAPLQPPLRPRQQQQQLGALPPSGFALQQQQQQPQGLNQNQLQERFQRLRGTPAQNVPGASFEQFPRPQNSANFNQNGGQFGPTPQQQQANQRLQLGVPTLSAFDLSSLTNLANNQPNGNNQLQPLQPTFRRIPPQQQQSVPIAPPQPSSRQQLSSFNPLSAASQFFDQSQSSRQTQQANNNNAPATELPFIRQVFRPAAAPVEESAPIEPARPQVSGGRPTPPPLFVPSRQQMTGQQQQSSGPPRRPLESGFSPIQPNRGAPAPQAEGPAFFEPTGLRTIPQTDNNQPQRQQQQGAEQQAPPVAGGQRRPPVRRPSQRPHVPSANGSQPVQSLSSAQQQAAAEVIRLATNAVQAASEGLASSSLNPSSAPLTTPAAGASAQGNELAATTTTAATTAAATTSSTTTPVSPTGSADLGRRAVSQAPPRTSANFFQTLTSVATSLPSSFSPALPINQAVGATGGRRRIPVRVGALTTNTGQRSQQATTPLALSSQQQQATTTAPSTSAPQFSSTARENVGVRRPEMQDFYETIGGSSAVSGLGVGGANSLAPAGTVGSSESATPLTTQIDGFGTPQKPKQQSATTTESSSEAFGSSSTTSSSEQADKAPPSTTTDLYGSRLPAGQQQQANDQADRQREPSNRLQQVDRRPQPVLIPSLIELDPSRQLPQDQEDRHVQAQRETTNKLQQVDRQQQPVMVPVTYVTTLTYLTTVLHGTHTLETSHEAVERSTRMATMNAQLINQIEHSLPLIEPTATVSLSSRVKGKGTTWVNLKSAVSAYNQELVEALSAAGGISTTPPQIEPTQVASLPVVSSTASRPVDSSRQQQPAAATSFNRQRPRVQPAGQSVAAGQQRPLRTVDVRELQELKKRLATEYLYSYTLRPVDQPDQLLATSVRSELVVGSQLVPDGQDRLMLMAALSAANSNNNANLIDSEGLLRVPVPNGNVDSELGTSQINLGSTVGKESPQTMTEVNMNVATYLKFDGISNVLVEMKPSAGNVLEPERPSGLLDQTPSLTGKSQLDTSFNVHMTLGNALEHLQHQPAASQQTPALESAIVTRPTTKPEQDLLRSSAVASQPQSSPAEQPASSSSVARSQLRSRVASSRFRSQFQTLQPARAANTVDQAASSSPGPSIVSSAVISETPPLAPSVSSGLRQLRPVKSRILRPSLLKPQISTAAPDQSASDTLAASPSPNSASSVQATTRSTKARFVVVTRTGQFGIRASAINSLASAASASADQSSIEPSATPPQTVRVSSRFSKPNRFRGGSQSVQATRVRGGAGDVLQTTPVANLPARQQQVPEPSGTPPQQAAAPASESVPVNKPHEESDRLPTPPSSTVAIKPDNAVSVIVTYFTTTTHTIPFELNSETVFTTIEETNSRIATEYMSDLSSHFIEPTPVANLPVILQTNAPPSLEVSPPPPLQAQDTSSSSAEGVTTSGQEQRASSSTQQATTFGNDQQQAATTPSTSDNQAARGDQQRPEAPPARQPIEPSFATTLKTQTHFTTFTYFTTYSAGSESQTVQSSESTTSNVVVQTISSQIEPSATFQSTGIEMTSSAVLQDQPAGPTTPSDVAVTKTLLSTMTYYGTVYNGTQTSLTPILDVSTHLLTVNANGGAISSSSSPPGFSYLNSDLFAPSSTQAPGQQQQSTVSMMVGQTAASSDPANEAASSTSATPPLEINPTQQVDRITRTRSMYTTLTHFITFFSGTKTQLSTIQEISPTVVTEYIDRTVFEQQLAESNSAAAASVSSSAVLVTIPASSVLMGGGELATTTTTTSSTPTANESSGNEQTSTTTSAQSSSQTDQSQGSSEATTTTTTVGSSTRSETAPTTTTTQASSSATSEPAEPDSVSVSSPASSPSAENQQRQGEDSARVLASSDQSAPADLSVESKQATNIIELSDLIASNSSQSGRAALAGNLGAAIKDIVQLLAGNKTQQQLQQQTTDRLPINVSSLPSTEPAAATTPQDQSGTSSAASSSNAPSSSSPKPASSPKPRLFGNKQRANELHGSITSPSTPTVSSTPGSMWEQNSSPSVSSAGGQQVGATPELNLHQASSKTPQQPGAAATIFFGDDSQDERKKQIRTVWPGAQSTVYVTSVEPSTRSLTVTTTKVYYTRDAQLTITSSYTSVIAPRTFVSTIMGTRTLVNQLNGPSSSVVPTLQQPAQASATNGSQSEPARAVSPTRPADTQNAAVANRYKQQKQQQQQVAQEQRKLVQQQQLAAAKQQQARAKLEQQQQQVMANINQCQPACKASANELCKFTPALTSEGQTVGGAQGTFACACRPGYFMMLNSVGQRQCQEVQSYVIMLRLLQVGDQQISFKRELQNRSSPEFKQFSRIVREHVKRAYMTSDLIRDRYVGSDILNFARTLSVSSGSSSQSVGAQPSQGKQPLALNASQLDPLNAGVIVNMTIHLQQPTQTPTSQANDIQVDETMLKEELTKKLNMRQAAALAAAASSAASSTTVPIDSAVNGQQPSSVGNSTFGQVAAAAPDQQQIGANQTADPMVEPLPNPNALFLADVEQVQDLDECASPTLNDCHEGAVCLNEPGSYKCDCREYPDLNPLNPGRQCANELKSCDYCNNRGDCLRVPSLIGGANANLWPASATNSSSSQTTTVGQNTQPGNGRGQSFSTVCQCHRIYLGRRCEINGLLLATLLPILAILLIISVCLIIYCCRRWRRRSSLSKGFRNIGSFGPNHIGSTLDRKAMLESSSESSDTHQRHQAANHHHHLLHQTANGAGGHHHQLRNATGNGLGAHTNLALYEASSEPSSSQESSPRQMGAARTGGVELNSASSYLHHLTPPNGVAAAGAGQAGSLNPYCSSITPQIVIPRARHNQVNYAVHRGQVYMW